jgi:GT2 family glycosyltransferase/SAM-dependent methyltransferase
MSATILITPHSAHTPLIRALEQEGRYRVALFGGPEFSAHLAAVSDRAMAEAMERLPGWERMLDAALTDARYQFSGFDLSREVTETLRPFARQIMPGFLRVALALERMHRETPLSLVIVHNEVAPNLRLLVDMARHLEIPSLHLVHGIPMGRLPMESFTDVVRADHLGVPGELSLPFYRAHPGNREEQFKVVGRAEWDSLSATSWPDRQAVLAELGLDPGRSVVGLAGSWAHKLTCVDLDEMLRETVKTFFEAVLSLGDQAPVVLVRPHPAYRDLGTYGPDWYAEIARDFGIEVLVPDLAQEAFLAASDLVVGIDSNFVAVAIHAGKKALSINFQHPGTGDESPYDGLPGVLTCARNAQAIAIALQSGLFDPDTAARLAAGRLDTLERINVGHDGSGTRRTIGLIDELIARSRQTARIPEGGYYSRINQRLARLVPGRARRILEVGCGAGYLGAWLKEQDPSREVVGFEAFPEAAREARRRLDAVVEGDVEKLALPYPPGYFDCILYGDVLEHLHDPAAVLRAHARHLAPGGEIAVCIPNVGHWSILKEILAGRFTYADEGLLDRTHLRFFTRQSFETVLNEAGMKVLERQAIDVPDPGASAAIALLARALGIANPEIEAQSNAYQLLFRASHQDARLLSTPPEDKQPELLPEGHGFKIVVLADDRNTVEAAMDAYFEAFAEGDDTSMFVLGAGRIDEVQGWLVDHLERRGLDPEHIPDVTLLEGPSNPADLPRHYQAADLVIGRPATCRTARDMGLPALELPLATNLETVRDVLAAHRHPAGVMTLEEPAPHRWLVSEPDGWEGPLSAYLEAVPPGAPVSLLVRCLPGAAEQAQEAIATWLERRGLDPEHIPDVQLVEADEASLVLLFRAVTARVGFPGSPGEALARVSGLPCLAPDRSELQRALNEGGDRCSVVVVTYNSESSIEACTRSVLETLAPGDELVVVDNASTDGTPRYLRSLAAADPRVRIHLSATNLGFSEGTNTGFRMASGAYLVMLNPDTVVTPGWLHRLRTACQQPGAGAAGPASDYVAGHQKVHLHLPAGISPSLPGQDLAMHLAMRQDAQVLETKLLIGFCMMVPRRVVEAHGMLDPDLFLGNDDLDLSWRLRQAGLRLLVATDTFVHHVGQVSFNTQPKERTRRLVQESTDILARKLVAHYGAGRVPSSRDLWGMDWFTPSEGILEGREAAPKRPVASLVILTLNQLPVTKLCLESVLKHTSDYELILIDNGSTDGTVAYLEAFAARHDFVKLVKNASNRGFAGGCNQGMALATGEFIVLLNNDTVVSEGWLEGLIRASSLERVGMVGPRTNQISGPQIVDRVTYDVRTLDGFEDFARNWREANRGTVWETVRVVGFCALIKREVIDRIGGLDAGFGRGNFEDDDFSLRVRIAGYRSIVTDEVFIHHFGSVTFHGEKVNFDHLLEENWSRFKNKWGLPPEARVADGYMALELADRPFDPNRDIEPLFGPCEAQPLADSRGFDLVVAEREPERLGAWIAAYLATFDESEDVALHVLPGPQNVERIVMDAIAAANMSPERIPDLNVLSPDHHPGTWGGIMKSADLVLGPPECVQSASDIGVPGASEPSSDVLRRAFENGTERGLVGMSSVPD